VAKASTLSIAVANVFANKICQSAQA